MLKRTTVMGAMLLQISVLSSVFAQEGKDVKDPVSYFLGVMIGQQFGQQMGLRLSDIEMEGLIAGFRDGIQNKEPGLTREQLTEAQNKLQAMIQSRQQEVQAGMEEKAAANKARGVKFLAENAKQEGIKELEGGIQYKELKAGTGPSPQPTDTVRVHYTGTLIDGTKFDSSVDRGEPATFPVNRVIQGWQIAIPEMKVGGKWKIFIPSELAYGSKGTGGIGPNEVLIFDVELLGIE